MSCSFGLLGASGCGKTTLLRCILSSLDPEYGEITVLGMEPGTRSSHVPGRDIGYMPQVTIRHAQTFSSKSELCIYLRIIQILVFVIVTFYDTTCAARQPLQLTYLLLYQM